MSYKHETVIYGQEFYVWIFLYIKCVELSDVEWMVNELSDRISDPKDKAVALF